MSAEASQQPSVRPVAVDNESGRSAGRGRGRSQGRGRGRGRSERNLSRQQPSGPGHIVPDQQPISTPATGSAPSAGAGPVPSGLSAHSNVFSRSDDRSSAGQPRQRAEVPSQHMQGPRQQQTRQRPRGHSRHRQAGRGNANGQANAAAAAAATAAHLPALDQNQVPIDSLRDLPDCVICCEPMQVEVSI